MPERRGRWRHGRRHMVIAMFNALPLALISATIMVVVLDWTARHGWGLLNLLPALPALHSLPTSEVLATEVGNGATGLVVLLVAVLLQDLWMYGWHRLNHAVPLLWRFHRMHHTDPELDSTSAFRFHTVEVTLSAILRLPMIMLFGLTMQHLVIYEMILLPVIIFHHANLSLPAVLDRLCRVVLVTPVVHHLHHSRVKDETNSNYSSVFSWWDRIFGSYRRRADPESIQFGVDGWEAESHQTVRGQLASGFRDAPNESSSEKVG